ncbi:hypothetical protein SAMN04488109_6722 [Chryseolinea serpens]|uniref:Outer membrane protein beta-barrel domain-containing protein n=1 Tax=Chryseolinea serpens TaxID=947013 RepID=A0A1M5XLP5_9BACT|nr:hypothetical protein [Chryseolinea serpens]SHI00775.1 hypothetical protein SAMN04488109_6722 [Chryseolinea serpens]
MDDNRFDSAIRKKLREYEHPGEPGALTGLHHQIAAMSTASWYSRHRVELLIGTGLLIVTMIILGEQWLITRELEEEVKTLTAQTGEIEKLRAEVHQLQMRKADTVRIIDSRQQGSLLTASLIRRIATLEETNRKLMADNLLQKNNGAAFVPGNESASEYDAMNAAAPTRITPHEVEGKSSRVAREHKEMNPSIERSLSAKTIYNLEKHYSRGVGLTLGPAVEFSNGLYSLGDGHANLGAGILADLIFSPSLALETGAKYSTRSYAIHDEQILANAPLPGVDTHLGDLQRAEIDYRMLEIPLNLKFRYPLSLANHWLAGIGYSSTIHLNEDLEYTYRFDNQTANPTSIISTATAKKTTIYPGTINLSLGFSHALKDRRAIEASLFYNHGLGTQGVEETRTRFFGVRGVYWFTIR